MPISQPSPIEIETSLAPHAAVIWLHGLGADGYDFEPIVADLVARGAARAVRFVFPHAPVRPVTLNGGARMRAWYDILALDRDSAQDEAGVRASEQTVRELIERELARGITSEHIVLAGFSQGGAMALFTATRLPMKLAGVLALSCYLPLASRFERERHSANNATPIFLAHGTADPIVDPAFAEGTRELLEEAGYPVEWHTYPMGHAVCAEEIAAIAQFLQRML